MTNKPEELLWYAVVQQAIDDYQSTKNNKDALKLKRSAGFWLFYSKSISIGSLVWICENIGIPIDKVRKFAKSGKGGSCEYKLTT